jgi:hypothetical protein
MGGFVLLGSLLGIFALLIPVALILGLFVVFALRGDPDEGGGRAVTLYLGMASFVGFITLLVSVTALSSGFADLASDDADRTFSSETFAPDELDFGEPNFDEPDFGSSFQPSGSSERDDDDRAWTSIIQALIAMAAALVVLRFHWPRLEAVRQRVARGSAPARMHQSYAYVVCFVVVVTMLVAASVATFNLVQAIAPGTTGAGNRGDAIESFVPLAVLAAGAAALFRLHWSRVDMPTFLAPPPPPAATTVDE